MPSRVLGFALMAIAVLAPVAQASPQQDLESAAKEKSVAFILVVEPGAPGCDQAQDLVRDAMRQVNKSTLVVLDRSDPENAELVAKFRLAGAPVPLILLAASNGALAGGLPANQATVDRLVAMAPSPRKADILLAIQEGKSVFIVASRKGMNAESGAVTTCSAACGQMNGKSVTFQIDLDDSQETAFLAQLKVNLASTEPITLVVNPQGQITATFAGTVDVANLVQAATKRASGCCPSSVQASSKSCAPKN